MIRHPQPPAPQRSRRKPARSCQLDAMTGCAEVPGGCSAASATGPGDKGPPASPQPLPSACPRRRELWKAPRFGGCFTSPHVQARSLPHGELQVSTAHPQMPATEIPGTGTTGAGVVLIPVMLGRLWPAGSGSCPYAGHSKGAVWLRHGCRQLPAPARSPARGEEAGERVPVPSGGTSGCDAVIANASGLIYGDEKMFPGFPQSPIKIPVPHYF